MQMPKYSKTSKETGFFILQMKNLGLFPGKFFYKSCLIYLQREITSNMRPPSGAVSLETFHCSTFIAGTSASIMLTILLIQHVETN